MHMKLNSVELNSIVSVMIVHKNYLCKKMERYEYFLI